jgi:hypothetical protein
MVSGSCADPRLPIAPLGSRRRRCVGPWTRCGARVSLDGFALAQNTARLEGLGQVRAAILAVRRQRRALVDNGSVDVEAPVHVPEAIGDRLRRTGSSPPPRWFSVALAVDQGALAVAGVSVLGVDAPPPRVRCFSPGVGRGCRLWLTRAAHDQQHHPSLHLPTIPRPNRRAAPLSARMRQPREHSTERPHKRAGLRPASWSIDRICGSLGPRADAAVFQARSKAVVGFNGDLGKDRITTSVRIGLDALRGCGHRIQAYPAHFIATVHGTGDKFVGRGVRVRAPCARSGARTLLQGTCGCGGHLVALHLAGPHR